MKFGTSVVTRDCEQWRRSTTSYTSCGPAPLLTNECDNRGPKLHECGNHVVAVFIYNLFNDNIHSLIRHLAAHPSVLANEYCECAIAYVTEAQVFIFCHERARLFKQMRVNVVPHTHVRPCSKFTVVTRLVPHGSSFVR